MKRLVNGLFSSVPDAPMLISIFDLEDFYAAANMPPVREAGPLDAGDDPWLPH